MKKLLIFLALSIAGCIPVYVRTARRVLPKTAVIQVKSVVQDLVFLYEEGQFTVHSETVTVRVGGSGVFITPNGHILTCAHLFNVGISSTITVETIDGRSQTGTLLYKDDNMDLALVKISRISLDYARLTSSPLEIGQEVVAVGNPRFLGFSMAHGIISFVHRDLGEIFCYTQTDTPINPGNSGGPLFNLQGELVGIVNSKIENSDGLGFATSPETIRKFLDLFCGL